jgi:hypothetical protein
MGSNEAMPRLRAQGLGADISVRTFRLTGIGESAVAEILGEEMLRQEDPEVATYARVEAVDVRVSAIGTDMAGRTAEARVDEAAAVVQDRLGDHIWAEGDTSWADAVGARLTALGWRLAVEELGTAGQVAALFGDSPWLALSRVRPGPATPSTTDEDGLPVRASAVRKEAGADVGVAVRVRPRGSEFAVTIAIVSPAGDRQRTHATYVGGAMGRSQSALLTAATLFEVLAEAKPGEP